MVAGTFGPRFVIHSYIHNSIGPDAYPEVFQNMAFNTQRFLNNKQVVIGFLFLKQAELGWHSLG
jgi:hypothetical protein